MYENIYQILRKNAFTLAEIMIALVVIGVITSILLPVAFNNVPNENVMKFKKGNATLAKVINELISSGQYYTIGDLSKKNDGTVTDDNEYFCKSFSDMITTKNTNCAKEKTAIAYNFDNSKVTFIEKYLLPQALAKTYEECLYMDSTGEGFASCYNTKCREAYNKKDNTNGVLNGDKFLIFKSSTGIATYSYDDGSTTIGYQLILSCPCSSSKDHTYTGTSLYACVTKNLTFGFYTNDNKLVTTINVVYPQASQTAQILKKQAINQVLTAYEESLKKSNDNSSSNSSTFVNMTDFKHCPINYTASSDGYISIKADNDDTNGDYLENPAREKLDELCTKYGLEEIKTSDNIIYYQTDPTASFGKSAYCNKNADNFLNVYKVICMDVDGINKGEDPFGYGIRIDGKIMRGKRASEWMNKSLQDKE